MSNNDHRSPVVDVWAWVFERLRFISSLWIPRLLLGRWLDDDTVKEIWASVPIAFAFISLLLIPSSPASALTFVASFVIAVRVLEILIVQANVLLFDQYRADIAGEGWAPVSPYRIFVLLLQNYVEVTIWFAVLHKVFQPFYAALQPNDVIGALALSFSSMTSFGRARAIAGTQFTELILLVEGVVGAFIALAVLARFVSLLPSPQGSDSESA